MNGFAFASWAARLPAIRDKLHLSTEQLGFLLLFMSVGSVLTLTMAGTIVRLLGPRQTVTVAAVISMCGIALLGIAHNMPLIACALAVTGAGIGSWDVSMNVEGADIERRLERSLMPRFHAAFSLGTIAGAGVGAVAALVELPVAVHLPVIAAVVLVAALIAVRWFMPFRRSEDLAADPDGGGRSGAWRGQLGAWSETTTLLIGVLVFSMALAEGSANDWLALSLVDGYGAIHALGAVGLGVFVTGMTATRMLGPYILSRYDHVLVLRLSALCVLAGTSLLILGAVLAKGDATLWQYGLAGIAALLWGVGAALGFPMGMSAASADPEHAATRVAVVSTIGYMAFIAGPPLLGSLAERIGTAQSMVAVSAAVLLALLTAHSVRRAEAAASSSEQVG